jgi:NTE family protein
MNKYRIGLVLSGGGARGMAHAGVLRALDELGICPDIISATSAGAIVGALYCDGMKPEAMAGILEIQRMKMLREISFDFKGLIKPDLFRNILLNNMSARSFEELKIPLVINVTDFKHASTVYFSTGELIEPIVASCTLPLVFSPLVINGQTLVDGGLLNNLPVEPLMGVCDKIIGVHVNPVGIKEKSIPVTRVLERCFHMAISNTIAAKAHLCDVFIEPPELSGYGVFETEKSGEMMEIGYRNAIAHAKRIQSALQ